MKNLKSGYVAIPIELMARVLVDDNGQIVSAEWIDDLKDLENYVVEHASKIELSKIEMDEV